nr:sulfated surface glycoprotein 185-like [Aegilops tauschii subsp. strangulata]
MPYPVAAHPLLHSFIPTRILFPTRLDPRRPPPLPAARSTHAAPRHPPPPLHPRPSPPPTPPAPLPAPSSRRHHHLDATPPRPPPSPPAHPTTTPIPLPRLAGVRRRRPDLVPSLSCSGLGVPARARSPPFADALPRRPRPPSTRPRPLPLASLLASCTSANVARR